MRERMLIIGVGCLLDLLFGDPHFLWHPVQGIGWLIAEDIFHFAGTGGRQRKKESGRGVSGLGCTVFNTGNSMGTVKACRACASRFKNCSFLRPVLSDACHEVFKDREHEGI